mmetsp:Transcript_34272/g.50866  ORF Transcript_34272/g.50866 Transcript_34272/m.50866 type:complete len:100 (-) Transcript_34272:511-810(-)
MFAFEVVCYLFSDKQYRTCYLKRKNRRELEEAGMCSMKKQCYRWDIPMPDASTWRHFITRHLAIMRRNLVPQAWPPQDSISLHRFKMRRSLGKDSVAVE